MGYKSKIWVVIMAWKNLKQRSLADSMMIEYEALKELDSVNELIEWTRLERVLKRIYARAKGREFGRLR